PARRQACGISRESWSSRWWWQPACTRRTARSRRSSCSSASHRACGRVQTSDARNQPLSLGSAVVIAPGTLVTNCHVLRKAHSVSVGHENVSYGATLDAPDPERDLCILKVRNFKAPAVQIGDPAALKTGARVYAVGSPRGLE